MNIPSKKTQFQLTNACLCYSWAYIQLIPPITPMCRKLHASPNGYTFMLQALERSCIFQVLQARRSPAARIWQQCLCSCRLCCFLPSCFSHLLLVIMSEPSIVPQCRVVLSGWSALYCYWALTASAVRRQILSPRSSCVIKALNGFSLADCVVAPRYQWAMPWSP